jgi:hypothetical protein
MLEVCQIMTNVATYAPIAPRPERNPKGTYAASAAGPVMTVTARLGQPATWQVRRVYDRGERDFGISKIELTP